MTTDTLAPSSTTHLLHRSIVVDLAFWTIVGIAAAALAVPAADLIAVQTVWLAVAAVTLAVVSGAALLGLGRLRPMPRAVVRAFAVFNLVGAPLVYVAAFFGWIPMNTAGTWALVLAGDAMLLLGIYQAFALRRTA